MESFLKAPHKFQRLSCTLEIASTQESDDVSENVMRVTTSSGQNLLSLLIAPEIGQHIAAAYAEATCSINIDGCVVVMFEHEFEPSVHAAAIPLDQLVASAVSADVLEDELDATAMLIEFRTRLLNSLEYVDLAIASLATD
jgi:hypothetical protein